MFPPEVTVSVAVYHLPTTAGSKQPYPGTASATYTGAFLPLDRHAHALEGGDFVEPHELYIDAAADVRVGDKLVIESTTYYVKSVFDGWVGDLKHQRCSISKQP